jgi:hypothetical protein
MRLRLLSLDSRLNSNLKHASRLCGSPPAGSPYREEERREPSFLKLQYVFAKLEIFAARADCCEPDTVPGQQQGHHELALILPSFDGLFGVWGTWLADVLSKV